MPLVESRQIFVVREPWFKVGCTLGEGPLYDPVANVLHFVDIVEKEVFHLSVETMNLASERFSEPITCLALRRDGEGVNYMNPSHMISSFSISLPSLLVRLLKGSLSLRVTGL